MVENVYASSSGFKKAFVTVFLLEKTQSNNIFAYGSRLKLSTLIYKRIKVQN